MIWDGGIPDLGVGCMAKDTSMGSSGLEACDSAKFQGIEEQI